VIFNQVLNSIESFAHLSNQNANDSKNFERFLELTNSSGKTLDKQTQYDFEFPLTISASIELGDSISGKFKLETESLLEIKNGDKILLKGPTGSGKTQFVNSLLGFVSGAMFYFGLTSSDPKKHSTKIEYMSQETREKIPSSGITVRQMLEGETDDELILDLIKMVLLEDKFNSNNLDTPMKGLSGGERMRLSILYTLWNFNKTGKQILILDEPEQGLDEDVRVIIIRNILESINEPILVIYHGSKLDLLQLPFNKAWIFGKKDGLTKVHEEPFSTFKEKLVLIIMDIIREFFGGFSI
jgi:ATPase subunit of ABC transporter with duplicated ATPase domains